MPDDAINQMHRYRDALIRLSENEEQAAKGASMKTLVKSRPVFGAFALYPGIFDQLNDTNPYAQAIDDIGIGAFALLPGVGGDNWLSVFLAEQIGQLGVTASRSETERLYVQEAARIPHHGMRQVLYPDLTLTVALPERLSRSSSYFDSFDSGSTSFYHMPVSTFALKLSLHIAYEVRFLAIIPDHLGTEPITKVWPVRKVRQLPRNKIDISITGKHSTAESLYFIFELGAPLTLASHKAYQANGQFRSTIKITTLVKLEAAADFNAIEQVYTAALAYDAVLVRKACKIFGVPFIRQHASQHAMKLVDKKAMLVYINLQI